MQKTIGYIGLGKMGANMVARLLEHDYKVTVYNKTTEPIKKAEAQGATGVDSAADLVAKLATPRCIWIMVPYQAVDAVVEEITPHLEEGDVVIDGGNSPYDASMERGTHLAEKGIHFMDVGVSGGPSGARHGACMMIGGDKGVFTQYEHLFRDLTVEGGYGYMGRTGAGHFVKMVHNGIEYGMMQALAEGFNLMKHSDEFDLPLTEVARVYDHGSVIESRLVQWLAEAYRTEGEDLMNISGEVDHSGEGKWTVEYAEKHDHPVTVINDAFRFRLDSQGDPSYTGKVVSALRGQFGGHPVENGDDNS